MSVFCFVLWGRYNKTCYESMWGGHSALCESNTVLETLYSLPQSRVSYLPYLRWRSVGWTLFPLFAQSCRLSHQRVHLRRVWTACATHSIVLLWISSFQDFKIQDFWNLFLQYFSKQIVNNSKQLVIVGLPNKCSEKFSSEQYSCKHKY